MFFPTYLWVAMFQNLEFSVNKSTLTCISLLIEDFGDKGDPEQL